MASRCKTFFATPFLLSIYKGPNKIANSQIPGYLNASFPGQYVHVGLAQYFSTYYLAPNVLLAPTKTNYFIKSRARCHDEDEACILIQNGDK